MSKIDKYINKVICGDCLEVMKDIPDNSVDLVVTSPPYNSGNSNLGYQPNSEVGQSFYGNNYNDNKKEKDYIVWINKVIKESLRVSRYVFWNMQFIRATRNCIFDIQKKYRNNLKDIFIWEKQCVSNITGKNGGLGRGWEYVFMFGKDNLSTFKYNNFPKNNYVPNIKTWYKKKSFKKHHATFPESLPKYFIQNFTNKNDIVLDPFLGSGTTAVACKELNRKFIGIELSEEYCNIARKRIKNTMRSLF